MLGALAIATVGCGSQRPARKVAARPALPQKIVLDYRFGWYHPSDGTQTIRQIADEYQRDPDLVAKLNQTSLDARPPDGKMVYIPPNNDIAYVRQSLVRINADPSIVPTEPWHPPVTKAPLASLKETVEVKQADTALKQVVDAHAAPVIASADSAAPAAKPRTPKAASPERVVAEAGVSDDAAPGFRRARPEPSLPAIGPGKFMWPVKGEVVTRFSEGWRKACHGIEIAAKVDEPVRAGRAGKVLLAQEFPGYGRLILIDHGDGLASVYAYLNTLMVDEGDRVKQGQQIATVGTKGSTPLFFFQIRKRGEKVDPMLYLN